MSFVTHPVAIWLRNRFRNTGLTNLLRVIRPERSYEEAVDTVLRDMVGPGDVVWDIGANVGHYTVKFARRVGPKGKVFAFEPSRFNLERLKASCAGLNNITALPIGLSSAAGWVKFLQGSDELGATSRVAAAEDIAFLGMQKVELCCGDDIISSGKASPPNVLKVDVEGHEYEVLEGMSNALKDSRLRALIIEIHFGLLASAGRSKVPRLIESRLIAERFELTWLDSSHLLATRRIHATDD